MIRIEGGGGGGGGGGAMEEEEGGGEGRRLYISMQLYNILQLFFVIFFCFYRVVIVNPAWREKMKNRDEMVSVFFAKRKHRR